MDNVMNQDGVTGIARRARLGAAVTVVLAALTLLGAVSEAHAGTQTFCTYAWVAPYGQSNDNCAANDLHYNYRVFVRSYEHSGCVSTTTNTSKSGVNATWSCTAGPGGALWKWVDPKAKTNGILRNNTTGDANHVSGIQEWCPNYGCS